MENKSNKGNLIALVVLLVAFSFSIGYLSAYVLNLDLGGFEKPFSTNSTQVEAPHDFVKENKILVYSDKVVIMLDHPTISEYAPTGSMRPLFDYGANGVRIKPTSVSDIHVGDIVTYQSGEDLIVHRVIEIGSDNEGAYFVTKGDNNSSADGKIRYPDIKYITVAIIY